MNENVIKHEGIVSAVKKGSATVRLVNISACSSCHAKAACNVSEVDNKEIEVSVKDGAIQVGDRIRVLLNEQAGVKALFLGYIVPFFFMMIALIITWSVTGDEIKTGLAAIAILVPYYLFLAIFKKSFNHTFAFRIESGEELGSPLSIEKSEEITSPILKTKTNSKEKLNTSV